MDYRKMKAYRFIILAGFLASSGLLSGSSASARMLKGDKDKVAVELYASSLFPLTPRSNSTWNVRQAGIVRFTSLERVDGKESIKVVYPANSANPGSGNQGGVSFIARPSDVFLPSANANATHIRFSYSIKFASNFQWVNGGMLPGLIIGAPGATGGTRLPNRGSYRVMWGFDGTSSAYIYPPEGAEQDGSYKKQPGFSTGFPFGDGLFRKMKLDLTRWNRLTLEIKLNSFDAKGQPRKDGLIKLGVNGERQSFDKMVWRTNATTGVYGIYFQSFFGGSGMGATPVNTSVYFTDVRATRLVGY